MLGAVFALACWVAPQGLPGKGVAIGMDRRRAA